MRELFGAALFLLALGVGLRVIPHDPAAAEATGLLVLAYLVIGGGRP